MNLFLRLQRLEVAHDDTRERAFGDRFSFRSARMTHRREVRIPAREKCLNANEVQEQGRTGKQATPAMISSRLIAAWFALAGLATGAATAQPRVQPDNEYKAMAPITDPAQVAEWLKRLVGHYKYDGMVQAGECVSVPQDASEPAQATEMCQPIKGRSDCIAVGTGPGVQCIHNVTWLDIYATDFESGTVKEVLVSYLDPAMELFGLDPANVAMNRLVVNNKGIAESGPGYIKGNTATFRAPCANSPVTGCYRAIRIEARPDTDLVWMWFSSGAEPGDETTYATMTLRRVAPEKAGTVDERMSAITAIEETEEEIALAEADAREEQQALSLDPPPGAAPPLQGPGKQPALGMLEDAVAEGESERQIRAPPTRPISNPDVVTATHIGTSNGAGSIRVRVQPYLPRREIRFRASGARQLARGASPHLKLAGDVLATDNETAIRSVNLEFNADMEETDGLPAVIPFSATTSIFNIDYLRLRDVAQPLMTILRNAMDPETRRCGSTLRLGGGGEDFQDRFVLMGERFGDCNRTVKSREGDLVFADAVPQRLRQELRDLYDPVYNRFARSLGSEPGIVFVVWRPQSPRNDFRFVRSLNRTSLLVFNGASWEQGFTPQQRDSLWEDVAREQIMRRIEGRGQPDAIVEAAAQYLLKLAQAERQHETAHWLTTQVPEWIAACARSMSLRVSAAAASRGIYSYDCGLVVQFVYDAVTRAASQGEDSVVRNWRTVLADAGRLRQDDVRSSAFLDTSADARRLVQPLLQGVADWTTLAVELARVGVQLRVTPGQIAPAVQVQSLANFRD